MSRATDHFERLQRRRANRGFPQFGPDALIHCDMEPLFKKILCPVDFDRVSIPALELTCKLADCFGASVCLLYVIPRPEAAEDLETVARENLRGIARKWLEGKVAYDIAVTSAEPAAGIVQAVKNLGADVIVMATHGRTGSEHDRLGSVAERVVQTSPCPVITVKPAAPATRK
jgi:nucleotide-binding universal stress UspA family protein